MRRAAKVDANQAEIVDALRGHYVDVVSLAPVGHGVPDLLCGYKGRNYLIEIKDGSKSKSRRTLTPEQWEFHRTWGGQVCVVESVEDVIRFVQEQGLKK